jgi:hypothetical protein
MNRTTSFFVFFSMFYLVLCQYEDIKEYISTYDDGNITRLPVSNPFM